jgi:hypothetical protein
MEPMETFPIFICPVVFQWDLLDWELYTPIRDNFKGWEFNHILWQFQQLTILENPWIQFSMQQLNIYRMFFSDLFKAEIVVSKKI